MSASNTRDLFGELRSAAQAEPSPHSWGRLCEALKRWPKDGTREEAALPYVSQSVASWPAALRVAQPWMVREALEGDGAALGVCAHVEIDMRLPKGALQQLIRSGALAHVERISLGPKANAQADALLLVTSEGLDALLELELEGQLLQDRHLSELSRARQGPALERLSLADNRLREELFEHVLAWPGAQRLVALDVSGNTLAPRMAPRRFDLARLERLDLGRMRCDAAALRWLMQTPTFGRLRALTLGAVDGDVELLGALLDQPVCGQLEAFECEWISYPHTQQELDMLDALSSSARLPRGSAAGRWLESYLSYARAMYQSSQYDGYYDDGDSWE